MLPLSLKTWRDAQQSLTQRTKSLRLFNKLKQSTLADMSGVSEASIKRFERTGEISLKSFLKIMQALGTLDQIDSVHSPRNPHQLDAILKMEAAAAHPPKRGRK
jgi:transcriptional regulator with XRE-family HTH domain